MSTLRFKFAPIAVCLAIGLAACGDDSSSTTTDAATNDATTPVDDGDGGGYDYGYGEPVDETNPAETTVATAGVEVEVILAARAIGEILTDEAGNTLYLFTPDPENTVTCIDGCADAWPGFLAGDSLFVGANLDAALFGTATGADGAPQITYNGHPLYYFAGDAAPGDTNGQGSGGVWYVVGADGNAITD
ncbi:MAG: hypothetical protein ABL953_13630 [Ilumatobacteraceae bacterium]